jgi:hypothetical protein
VRVRPNLKKKKKKKRTEKITTIIEYHYETVAPLIKVIVKERD